MVKKDSYLNSAFEDTIIICNNNNNKLFFKLQKGTKLCTSSAGDSLIFNSFMGNLFWNFNLFMDIYLKKDKIILVIQTLGATVKICMDCKDSGQKEHQDCPCKWSTVACRSGEIWSKEILYSAPSSIVGLRCDAE